MQGQDSDFLRGLSDAQKKECLGVLSHFQLRRPKDDLWVEADGVSAKILCQGQGRFSYSTVYRWNLTH